MKRCLYLSSWHCDLERQELELFNELGISTLSVGKFLNKRQPRMNSLAEPLDVDTQQDLVDWYLRLNPHAAIWTAPKLSKNFVNRFDFVYIATVGPNKNYFRRCWDFIKHKPIIMRTYGLQTPEEEWFLAQCKKGKRDLYTIRFSEKEKAIQNYAGTDIAILPYIDENQFNNWNGKEKQVFTSQNWFRSRSKFEPYNQFLQATTPFNLKLCGIETPTGPITREAQIQYFKDSRVYFSLGSRPSPVTINIFQALMTGAPTVTWGHKNGDSNLKMYQIPEIITNYKNGLCSDDSREIQAFIKKCFDDYDYAKKIGDAGRELALKTFSKAAIKPQWQAFLSSKGLI